MNATCGFSHHLVIIKKICDGDHLVITLQKNLQKMEIVVPTVGFNV